MLDLGYVTAIQADNSLEEVVAFASQNRFKCLEVMCWPKGKAERRYAGVTHIDVDQLSDQEVARIQKLFQDAGIYISGLGYYPNPLDPDLEKAEVYIAHIKKLIMGAARLGVPVVNTFVGREPSKTIEWNLDRYAEVWPEIVKLAEQKGVKIGIENCPMLFTKDEWPGGKNLAISPAIWDQMFERIPSEALGLNYDPSHLVWMQMDEIQPIYDFSEKLYHIHLKDVKVYRDRLDRVGIMGYPLQFHSPKLPGLGYVRWGHFFSALTSVGYRGPVCVEVEDKAYEKTPEDIRTAILTSRQFISQYLIV